MPYECRTYERKKVFLEAPFKNKGGIALFELANAAARQWTLLPFFLLSQSFDILFLTISPQGKAS